MMKMVFWIKNNHGIYFSPEYMKKLNPSNIWYRRKQIKNDAFKKGYLGLSFDPDTSELYYPNEMSYCFAKIKLINPNITIKVLWDKETYIKGRIFSADCIYKPGISFILDFSYPYDIIGTNINKIILNHFSNSIIKNKKDKIIFKSDRNTLFKVLNYYKNNLYVSNNILKLH